MNLRLSETGCSSSSLKPLLPKPWILRGGDSDGNNGGLLLTGNVVHQQSAASNGLSPRYGDQGLSVDHNGDHTVMDMSEPTFRPPVSQQLPSTSSSTRPSAMSGTQAVKFEDYLWFIKYAREYSEELLKHTEACTSARCPIPLCGKWKIVLQHLRNCPSMQCPTCAAVHGCLESRKRKNASLSGSADFVSEKRMRTQNFSAQVTATAIAVPLLDSRMHRHDVVQNAPSHEGVQVSVRHEVAEMRSKHFAHLGILKKNSEHTTEGAKETTITVPGISLIEFFTPEQIREHIISLRKWTGSRKPKAAKRKATECPMKICKLCEAGELHFEVLPLNCNGCGDCIPVNYMFYTIRTSHGSQQICSRCYRKAKSDTIEVNGTAIVKAKMEQKKNNDKTAETWVECATCKAWQHQICALVNARKDVGALAQYTCPTCCIGQIERGERKPLPKSSYCGAKDLKRTILSDHLEKRLVERLKQERTERAKLQGKKMEQVPGAEGLVLRVVSSVDKTFKVKPNFLETFQDFPVEFPYKSKAILLFQNIEGVEVCLFCMFVQEYGSECQGPNQRRVYLSYLDSVKYFRPEIAAVTGEALRTFVYHEILIGYLDYCKTRGFTSCYIWACPPTPGDNYIFYCHPEIQKTPKPDQLKEWYHSLIQKAIKEKIVVEYSNLYDRFFLSTKESKAKVTSARLPYFDGDHWPNAAEDMINKLRQGMKTKTGTTKRALKDAGLTDISGNASMDYLLMQEIGKEFSHYKDYLIMVPLQYACSHCHQLMVSGNRWVCKGCRDFQLCDKCHATEEQLDVGDRHPSNSMDKHVFNPLEVGYVPVDTEDRDGKLESEHFDTRHTFLGICQGNYCQFDTLRRAKHSSMILLDHLHDVQAGQGPHCETCKDKSVKPPRKLKNQSTSDHHLQKSEARQNREAQLKRMLTHVLHSCHCKLSTCSRPNCLRLKSLFAHGKDCKTHASGGCVKCQKMWNILRIHAQYCKKSECKVPHCKHLKSEFPQRTAVMQTVRQRNAAVNK